MCYIFLVIERETLITQEIISSKVRELGDRISEDYKDKNLLLVGVLKGSFVFLADLVREINLPDLEVDFIEISSYGKGTESSRSPKFLKDTSIDITGRNVLVVEDIVDTGYSFKTLLSVFESRGVSTLKTCALLSKPDKREVEVPIDYLGFEIGDKWVEGYGIDTLEKFRGLKYIAARNLKT